MLRRSSLWVMTIFLQLCNPSFQLLNLAELNRSGVKHQDSMMGIDARQRNMVLGTADGIDSFARFKVHNSLRYNSLGLFFVALAVRSVPSKLPTEARCPLVVYRLSLRNELAVGSIEIGTRWECRVIYEQNTMRKGEKNYG